VGICKCGVGNKKLNSIQIEWLGMTLLDNFFLLISDCLRICTLIMQLLRFRQYETDAIMLIIVKYVAYADYNHNEQGCKHFNCIYLKCKCNPGSRKVAHLWH